MKQGKLIVFEGGEGSGKTTQLERSRQWLIHSGWLASLQTNGCIEDLVITREPGGTHLGISLRQLLLQGDGTESLHPTAELLIYAADRAQHVEAYLRPHLASGHLILCDRYTDSTVAYQGDGRGLDHSLIDQLNQTATGGLTSDLTLWLDVAVETGLKRVSQRGKRDRLEQADLAFHQRVRQGFASLAQRFPDRIVRIDGSGSEAAIAGQIQAVLSQRLRIWYGSAWS